MPMSNSKLQVETGDVESADLLKPLQRKPNKLQGDWAKPTSPFRSCEWLSQWVRIDMRFNLEPTTPMRPALKLLCLIFKVELHLGCVPGDLWRNSEEIGRRRTKNNLIHELSMRWGFYYFSKIKKWSEKKTLFRLSEHCGRLAEGLITPATFGTICLHFRL